MNRRQFEAVVDRTLGSLPPWVAEQIDNLHVVVEERPDEEQGDILGIYEGVSLLDRASDYTGALPDRIVIFRVPHMELGLDDEDLETEIRRTVLHEIAHHIGIGDQRLTELGWD